MATKIKNDIEASDEALRKQFDKNSDTYHAKDIPKSSAELKPVPLGGKRVPKGMEDHANWENLPIVKGPNSEHYVNNKSNSTTELENACNKSDTYISLMETRNTIENCKKYIANVARNIAVLSKAQNLIKPNDGNQSELPTTKPANTRPQSQSVSNAKQDMEKTLENLKNLSSFKAKDFSSDNNISNELKTKCTESIELANNTLKECVETGILYAEKDISKIQPSEIAAKVTNSTRILFQTKNKLLQCIKDVKNEIALKYNIPVNAPVTTSQ